MNLTEDNLELIKFIKDIDIYDIVKEVHKRNIDILTLKEDRSKIDEILVKNTNIIEIDRYLERIRNENMLCE